MTTISLCVTVLLAACLLFGAQAKQASTTVRSESYTEPEAPEFVGGVYAMSNNLTANTLVVYARREDGTIQLLDPALETGGKGAILNMDLFTFDPLFSAFSLVITDDNKFVMAVNAGSGSVSVFKVLPDFSLSLVHIEPVPGLGPTSIAVHGNIVYVSSPDADGEFDDVFSQKGALFGFFLSPLGKLIPLPRSKRLLTFRPSSIRFSPDGRTLIVSNLFSGVNALATGGVSEIFTFRVVKFGFLSLRPVSVVGSTELFNAEGRNLPGVIGFEVVEVEGVQYVVAPEVRFLAAADGSTTDVPDQVASISTWRLDSFSNLFPVELDVFVGSSLTSGQMASCWIEFSEDLDNFWVANTPSDSVSSFSFSGGFSTLLDEVAASDTFPTDLWRSIDGKFLYQLFSGSVGAFEVSEGGVGAGLTLIQNPMNVPVDFATGIVAF